MTTSSRSPIMPVLEPNARARINAELQSGERLLWAGQPIPALFARGAWPLMIFGFFFGGFALFWILMAGGMIWFTGDARPRESGMSAILNCFPLFGVPFLLIGLGMITSPIWMRRMARRTVYAVTDRRAIVCTGKFWGGVELRSFPPDELDSMTRVERSGGAGDLIFREHFSVSHDSDGRRSTHRRQLGFIGIDRVRDVESLIRAELLRGASGVAAMTPPMHAPVVAEGGCLTCANGLDPVIRFCPNCGRKLQD